MVVCIRLNKILNATHVYTGLIQTSLNLSELEPAQNKFEPVKTVVRLSRLAFSLTRTTLEVGLIKTSATKAKNVEDNANADDDANTDDDPNDDANNVNDANNNNTTNLIIVVVGVVVVICVIVYGVVGINVIGVTVIIGSIINHCFKSKLHSK